MDVSGKYGLNKGTIHRQTQPYAVKIAARSERHDDSFQRGVTVPLADAVYGTFHLAHAALNGVQRIG